MSSVEFPLTIVASGSKLCCVNSPLFGPDNQWASRFGCFVTTGGITYAADTVPIGNYVHAEAQRTGVIGADFDYSARITIAEGVEAHLQCRISDEGRYGVRLRGDGLTFYRFFAGHRPCATPPVPPAVPPSDPVFAHCPNWHTVDRLEFQPLLKSSRPLSIGSVPFVRIVAKGTLFQVFLDGDLVVSLEKTGLPVGRFGIYVFGQQQHVAKATYREVQAVIDPTQRSNFALLYSTLGYERTATKRALVRTLNDLPVSLFDEKLSRYRLVAANGDVVRQGPLRPLPWGDGSAAAAKTFGMQLWEADFSAHGAEDVYTIVAEIGTANGVQRLRSEPFPIATRLITERMLPALAMRNAEARRAADEDMRRNWIRASGAWSVGLDGAFVAERADYDRGALLLRVFNTDNHPCNESDFRLFARITIVLGCDAQVQFRIGPGGRYGVTLQAGAGGNCTQAGGPGAVRLHREWPHGQPGFPNVQHQDLDSMLFPLATPFRAGQPYDIHILVRADHVSVRVSSANFELETPEWSAPAISENGSTSGFALKAWGSTVRFENVQAWDPKVVLRPTANGTQRPFFRNRMGGGEEWVAVQTLEHQPRQAVDFDEYERACHPFFTQLHGFHDANHNVAEATSHGIFLAGLMDVWVHRGAALTPEERESLRHAIIALVLYIDRLYHQAGGETGEFAHSEMGRAGVDGNLGAHQTLLALYGLTAFADRGRIVDPPLTRLAFDLCQKAARFLENIGSFEDPIHRSVIYTRLARCAEREGSPISVSAGFWRRAEEAADGVLTFFRAPGFMGRRVRDTGDAIPWFEGVYELVESRPEWLGDTPYGLNDTRRDLLQQIADIVVDHIARPHADENGQHPANGFLVVPQGSGDEYISDWNWKHMEAVPEADRHTTLPYLHNYIVTHFARSAADVIHLGRLLNRADLEPIAWSSLAWILGVNPGLSASKVVGGSDDGPWRAAAFVYNSDAPFARTMQGFRVRKYSAKGWMAPWEESADSARRETWSVDPLPNGFKSIVNGHMIWDRQWDYWNSGGHFNENNDFIADGWSSGETFILHDGAFLKSALLFEDWRVPNGARRENPYDTSHLTFFDTTHVERLGTGWRFDDPDRASFAQASRAATEFAAGKGFGGGRFTGHCVGEKIGLLCLPVGATFVDASYEEIADTGLWFDNINTVHWAHAARAATAVAVGRGFVAGFFTGHELNERRGVICLDDSMIGIRDVPRQDLQRPEYGLSDINAVSWAQAARAATTFCLNNELAGGYFTGEELDGHYRLVFYIR